MEVAGLNTVGHLRGNPETANPRGLIQPPFVSHDPFLPHSDSSVGEGEDLPRSPSPVQGRRVLWGVGAWAVMTLGALLLAWSWPQASLLHFWLVAQAVPVLYWLLMVWVLRSPARDDHVA